MTGRNSLEECSPAELARLAQQYPAFSTAHILAALRDETGSQIPKAGIFFRHPTLATLVLQELPATTSQWESAIAREEGIDASNMDSIPSDADELTEDSDSEALPVSEEPIALPADPDLDRKIAAIAGHEHSKSGGLLPTDTLSFEPYHTVDYFASQGIRFREEPVTTDKFSVQLRSFTDWLKTMKRLPVSEVGAQTTATEEKKVVQMAETSIVPREILTETMAEVWEKQGDHARAARIYEKLSLLDPAKSAYFAAKIENLKSS